VLGERIRVIGHYHNVDTWETWRQLQLDSFLARRRDLNLAVSEAVRRNVIEKLHLAEGKIRTLYNGVDTEEFRPLSADHRETCRQILGLPRDALVVAMVARLVSQKNHAFVIENARDLLRDFPQMFFVFAGSGPLETELKNMAVRYGVIDHILFLGARDDVPQLLACSDMSILPSSREGFSNTILESLACGLPVVASDVGGAREVIEHGINGYLVEMEPSAAGPRPKAADFVRLVRRLAADATLRQRLGGAARETALRFSLDAMVAQTEAIYLELMGRK
jgi:glycosyltransferase involved in cell wall biosynthesis